MTQNVSSAVMQQRAEPHDSLDDFPTPPWATRALIEHIIMPAMGQRWLKTMTVREPTCNRGYMARPLKEQFGCVLATDIFDYGWDGMHCTMDYLFPGGLLPAHWTIFNPPFQLAEQFIMRSFETPGWCGTAAIVRTAFLEGGGRYERLFSVRPPSIVAQHVERVIMTKGIVRDPSKLYWDEQAQKFRRPSTATAYCWLIWLHDYPWRDGRFQWIPPCRLQMERPGDYPETKIEQKPITLADALKRSIP